MVRNNGTAINKRFTINSCDYFVRLLVHGPLCRPMAPLGLSGCVKNLFDIHRCEKYNHRTKACVHMLFQCKRILWIILNFEQKSKEVLQQTITGNFYRFANHYLLDRVEGKGLANSWLEFAFPIYNISHMNVLAPCSILAGPWLAQWEILERN